MVLWGPQIGHRGEAILEGGGSRVGGGEGDTETNTGGGEEEVVIYADTHNNNSLEFIFEEMRSMALYISVSCSGGQGVSKNPLTVVFRERITLEAIFSLKGMFL